MRKFRYAAVAVLLFCLLLPAVAVPAFAGSDAVTALLGVNDKMSDVLPVLHDGSYYAPVRGLAGAMDLRLTGTPDELSLLSSGGLTLALAPSAGKAVKPDGTSVQAKMYVDGGNTMVPIGLVAPAFGYRVFYSPEQAVLRMVNDKGAAEDVTFLKSYQQQIAAHLQELKASQAAKPSSGNGKPSPGNAKPSTGSSGASHGSGGKPVYLTFDDGPSSHTGQLLDVLDKYGAKATFFMLGNHITSYPNSVKRMVKEGDAVGLHGMTHVKDKFYASPAAALNEMNNDNERLYKAAGVKSKLIRPPYGSKPYFVASFRDKVLGEGYHLWDWNVDSEDWKYKEDTQSTYNSIMKQVAALDKKGTAPVILMHDLPTTIKVLPQVLDGLSKKGYSFEIITADSKPVNFWNDFR